MTARVEIRPMQAPDLVWISRLERQVHVAPWSRKNFEDCLGAGYDAWVILANGKEAGYAIVMQTAGEAELLNIAVAPHWQGQRVGSQALAGILDWARARELAALYLEVRTSNTVARQLYESAGFNEMHVRRNYYVTPAGREDAVVMGIVLSMPFA